MVNTAPWLDGIGWPHHFDTQDSEFGSQGSQFGSQGGSQANEFGSQGGSQDAVEGRWAHESVRNKEEKCGAHQRWCGEEENKKESRGKMATENKENHTNDGVKKKIKKKTTPKDGVEKKR